MIDKTESARLAEEIKTAPKAIQPTLRAALRQMKRLEKLEEDYRKHKKNGGTPIPFME